MPHVEKCEKARNFVAQVATFAGILGKFHASRLMFDAYVPIQQEYSSRLSSEIRGFLGILKIRKSMHNERIRLRVQHRCSACPEFTRHSISLIRFTIRRYIESCISVYLQNSEIFGKPPLCTNYFARMSFLFTQRDARLIHVLT